ncbi:HAD family hydrolase [Phytopseudomonas seleniipraecipitans]|uniref:Haloacid dehalogenase superfamily, subfamily IA, variant 1 with third motif having Dx(3-4)D or Dx(3-4)E n=1 Tax=Phytopseudomonas seleniipraecipitans TaxID=640205 RepID=A0A1G7RQE6_9GAMM|nr:HAD-IA family hydrolase [Pseudomonas seleniipraecipitans]SDG12925.1 haloacid dehalogenase superfamily, subfamily IA, variant 1 with third motif having Dx(3-4)D or Dx(3-4)E [Pseudomonas seleniipraecipitans]
MTAVIFDVFGTLIRIEERRNPYLQLLRYGREQGLSPSSKHLHMLMTRDLGWGEAADRLGVRANYVKLREIAQLLQQELESMTLYPDALEAISMLREAGIKVGLCSNLASEYGPAVRELLPGLDACGFSYEIGAMKPNPVIYHSVCRDLGVQPGQQLGGARVAMIGDSIRCDRDGARAAGLAGFHLSRSGKGDFSNLIDFAECILEEKRIGFLNGKLKVPDDFDGLGRACIERGSEGEP